MKKFVISAAALLMAGSANAAVLFDGMPTGPLYVSGWGNYAQGQNFMVRFDVATDVELTGFSILAADYTSTTVGTMTRFKLRTDAGSDTPSATNLASFATAISSVSAYAPGIEKLTVNFAPITLSAGSYWAGLSGETSDISWASYKNSVQQPSGQWQLNGNNNSFRPYIYNLAFEVTGDAVAAGVPEPAAWAMMLAGFGLVGGAMRRRSPMVAA